MAEEAKKSEEKKGSTPESTRSIREASPEDVAEAEANQKKAEEEGGEKKAEDEGEKKGEGEKKPDPKAPEVDYKAELEIVSKKLKQAEFLLTQKNIEDKKKRDAEKEAEESADKKEGEDSKPEPDDVDKKLEETQLSKEVQDIISEELKSLSDNEDERALIEFHFKNSLKRSGDSKEAIKADLANARFLANKKRFEKLEGEIDAKDKSKPGAGNGSGGHNIEGDAPKDTPNVSDADMKLLKRYGLKPEDIKS